MSQNDSILDIVPRLYLVPKFRVGPSSEKELDDVEVVEESCRMEGAFTIL